MKKKKKNTVVHSSHNKKKNIKVDIEKPKKKHKVKRKWWKKLLSFFIVCCAFGIFAVFAFCIYIVQSCDEFDPNALANQDQTIIYDSQNNIIAKLGMEKRESVSYDKLPQVLIDAIVATEDSRFFQHNGVDGARFLKASIGQVLGHSYAGGASTLTMQVVKNNLTSTKQSITRKFQDIYLAVFFMERKYTKEEIIEFYVNDSLLGGNVYGVEEASKYYFGKSVSDLSLPEAALIAGLFQSPNGDNPYKNPDRAKNRMNIVLKLMVRHGYITQEEADMASKIDVTSLLVGTNNSENIYQGFIDTVVSEVQKKTGNDPALVSMQVYTTMDPSIQDGINKIMKGESYSWVNDKIQGAVTIIDVKTGAISAVGTGRNRSGERQWNYATQTKRQPGSTAKPIFAYAPGFEFDNFSTYQLFVDEPWSYTSGGQPGNWDGNYQGLMTLRTALGYSRNIPAIKSFQTVNKDVGNKKIVDFVEGLGIKLKDNVAYESYAIGGLETGVTTTQMAAAYAAFANGGYYTEPYTVKSITYRSTGETTEFETKRTQAMKDSTAYLITNVLYGAANGAGFDGGTANYRNRGGTVAAKTGTSNYDEATMRKHGLPYYAINDLWTVAYTPQYSIALWYGYDNIDSQYFNKEDGEKNVLMTAVMRCVPVTSEKFNVPSSVVDSQVEFGTWPAALPSEYTPGSLIRTEYFVSGTEPTEVSERFQKLGAVTNLKATANTSVIKVTWDHKEPNVLNQEYLNKYFSQSVFGNSTGALVNERNTYNNDVLGGLAYEVTVKNGGNIVKNEKVREKSYTYIPLSNGDYTISVRTTYANYGNNASDEVSTKVAVTGIASIPSDNDNDKNQKGLVASLIGNKTIELTNDESYVETGLKVTYDGVDVTSKSKITYKVNGSSCTVDEIENKVKSALSTSKEVKITYHVVYQPANQDESVSSDVSRIVKTK